MITVEIRHFLQVISYTLQQSESGIVSFHELWQACDRAAISFNVPGSAEPKAFVRLLLRSLNDLEDDGILVIHTKSGGERVSHVTLTDYGRSNLNDTIFSHQDRLNKPVTNPQATDAPPDRR